MIYEMRSYRVMPGRMPDLLKRFDTITLKLFDKHGIRQAGFWTTEVGEFQPEPDVSARPGLDGASASRNGRRSRPIRNGSPNAARPRRTARWCMTFSNQFLKPTSFSSVK